MARHALGLLVVFALLFASPAAAQASNDDPMRRLFVLIGSWDVDDVYHPISGPDIREVGVRTCAYALQDRYVECVTRGRNQSGREREYRWLINYNTETRRYDIVGVFSNYTGKTMQTIRIDSSGTVWNIRAPSSFTSGVEQWSWAQLVFDGGDRAVWTGYRNLETNGPAEWSVSTRETWVRRPISR